MRTLFKAAIATTLFASAATQALAQDAATTTTTTPAYEQEQDVGFDLGWLGLLGLAGLLGLRRKKDDHVRTTDTTRR